MGANYSDLTVTSTKVHLDTRSDPKNLLSTPFYVGMFWHLAAALMAHTITITEMIEDTTLYTLMVPLLYVDKSKFATARENLVRKKTEALVERLAPKAAAINVMMKRLANPMNKDRIMLACNETTVLKAEDSCRTMHVLRLAAPRLYKIQDQMRGSSAPHCDLTVTSLETWLVRGIGPKWFYFRFVKYVNLPRIHGGFLKLRSPSHFLVGQQP